MTVREQVALASYTTLGLGGPAARFVAAASDGQLVETVRAADASAEPVLALGGGSNLVVADEGFPGVVVRIATRGVRITPDGDGVTVAVAAGEDWDPLVQRLIGDGLSGLECLSGIPGLTGATPIQNVGAYGHEVAETIAAVRAYDRLRDQVVDLSGADCGFGYRTSALKRRPGAELNPAAATGRFVVLGVTFGLARDRLSAPVGYPELARVLGTAEGGRVPLEEVRSAVLALRRAKGMVLDPGDPDTRSAGSFFTNPVLEPDQAAEVRRRLAARTGQPAPALAIPQFPAPGGRVKIPAGWLIEQAGFSRGYPPGGRARISAKHTLALTNPGGASTADLVALARQIRDGVRAAFGVELVSEPALVGTEL